MSTDLRAALRQAVADAPFDESDLRDVVAVGSRRVRRRAAVRIGAVAFATATVAVLTSVVVGSDGSDQEPRPADVLHLDLDGAERRNLDVLASARTTWREPMNELDHDQFEGLTSDGLVLRSRYTSDGDVYELGLLDPATGSMDWLPSPPAGANQVVELAADRLALFGHPRPLRGELVVFDRQSETWESTTMRLPDGLEAHVPSRVLLAPDGRIYLGSTFEGESGPMHWWSYAVGGAGEARPETTLTGSAVAWADGHQATADNHGRVVVSSSARERIVADERPLGCEVPTDPELAEIPVTIGLAGNRPVVTYWCGDDPTLVTLVYDVDGAAAVQVAGASLLTADEDHVLLVSGEGGPAGLYLLDLDRLAITRIGPGIHEVQVGLADGLVLWNQPGPIDDRDVYDVVWKVARLPDGE